MKENEMKPSTGIILAMLGLVLYNLFKGSKVIIAIAIIFILASIYKIYKSYKSTKSITYDSMAYIVCILAGIIIILYEENYNNISHSLFIPISVCVFTIFFIIIGFLNVRKSGDKQKIKLITVSGIITIVLALLFTAMIIMWS
ncbi:hypothetical protein [Clostridium sp. UBA1056]|uniref:hypothetical protein n=1 Tax=unclassified Clostridium TaxID=2614128 RepID=UPI0032177851